jgi:GNAT superfamily N-acetyltransferase
MIAGMTALDDHARRIEEAALRAWPAHTDTDFDGWRLRFADGYTRRANSITPLSPSRLTLTDKIATCERLYADRGLPATFRLTPFAPPELDGMLAERGYRRKDEVEVRACLLSSRPQAPKPSRVAGTVRSHAVGRWLDIFELLSGTPATNRAAHRAILNAAPGVRRLLAFWVEGVPVACGMSVLCDGLLGLFDLVTAPAHRNLGYGSEFLRRAVAWGARAKATEAYLQVLERNAGARRIYERAGFEFVYRYHYREPK